VPGLANIHLQEGHVNLKDLCEGRNSVYVFRKGEGVGLKSIERGCLQTVSYTKSTDEWQAVGLTGLDTIQRNNGLMFAVLN
jgi:hypothetical protein